MLPPSLIEFSQCGCITAHGTSQRVLDLYPKPPWLAQKEKPVDYQNKELIGANTFR
jgi:hypothetical protein